MAGVIRKAEPWKRRGFSRWVRYGGVELPDWNGLVPDEDERHGAHQVRRAAKRVRLRKPKAVQAHRDYEARECAVLLALAAPRQRVPGARERERGARIAIGAKPAQVGGEKHEKSSSLPLPVMQRPQSFRLPPVSPLLARLSASR